ncbi:FecR domain-containing protein [Bradyrhizobium sp. Ash2021]|uniref:FecR family protein n=1 Tax=Bradyrhizobium sp. Ash2021 TaxID=2954771 RepID=UPI0028153977|nr:FecR domain-containing protein [Bradyrhizobium sp. Ash2021]WMT73165.1 FecR family protein [Bradyrhizobium sp. Ash2021]
MRRWFSFALLLVVCCVGATDVFAASDDIMQLAQAQPAPAQPAAPAAPAPVAPNPAAPAADAQPAVEEPIGNVATLTGSASVTRSNETTPLKVKDDIYLNDLVQTAASSTLGVTFNDATTFNLKASSQITIDNYVYEDGGKNNSAIFDVAKGTVAFVAASVAKTGDMKITTPTASLGIRGTTGLVEVPQGAAANNPNNVAIKLYPDADGRVGRIEVNDRAGARLGFLTQGASGFTIRPGVGGARVAAVPLTLSPQQIARDQGFVRQVHTAQTVGWQVVDEQRAFRRANPGVIRGNPPRRSGPQQPGQQNRPGQPPQPGQPNRPGQPPQPGAPNRQGSTQPQPGQATVPPRSGQALPGQPGGTPLPRSQAPNGAQPGVQQQGGQQPGIQQPNVQRPGVQQPSVRQPGARPPGVPQPAAPQQAQPHSPGIAPAVPGLQRPGLQNRPALPPRRLPPPPRGGKPPKEKRR